MWSNTPGAETVRIELSWHVGIARLLITDDGVGSPPVTWSGDWLRATSA